VEGKIERRLAEAETRAETAMELAQQVGGGTGASGECSEAGCRGWAPSAAMGRLLAVRSSASGVLQPRS
jgi:hypothetical protein